GGSVTLTASSGTKYLWAPGGQTTQSITVTATGSYSVTVTDQNSCTGTAVQQVYVLPPLSVSISATNTNLCSGSVVLSAVSSSPGTVTKYFWSNGATTQSITVTSPGSY